MAKATFDLEENMAGALCYVLGWITGIIFYILEKENKTVRFHALQSIIVFLPLTIIVGILQGILLFIPFIGWAISGLMGLLMFILWLILMLKAYRGEKFKLPIVGDIAEKHA